MTYAKTSTVNPTISKAEEKALDILKYAPVALVEIDEDGTIQTVNIIGEVWLKPMMSTHNISGEVLGTNIFPILDYVCPGATENVRNKKGEYGIVYSQAKQVSLLVDGVRVEKNYEFTMNKMADDTIMISFDDTTEKLQREKSIQQAILDKAVEQSKYEVASGVLHDIGNAIVGFGSYLTRIRRIEERSDIVNLQQLAAFFGAQQAAFATAIGEVKAGALVDMLNGIVKSQEERHAEINKAITEQLKIITHVQEILDIQRQYVSAGNSQERKTINLRSIINDCMAMLLASFDKKGIEVQINTDTASVHLNGDRTQLMQVILNILKNSLEAIDMQSDRKTVRIDLESFPDALVLKVRDSGIGFNQATGAKLFERGFTTKHSGSGLGLYNCRSILESHDGKITMSSEGEGKGTLTEIRFCLNKN